MRGGLCQRSDLKLSPWPAFGRNPGASFTWSRPHVLDWPDFWTFFPHHFPSQKQMLQSRSRSKSFKSCDSLQKRLDKVSTSVVPVAAGERVLSWLSRKFRWFQSDLQWASNWTIPTIHVRSNAVVWLFVRFRIHERKPDCKQHLRFLRFGDCC